MALLSRATEMHERIKSHVLCAESLDGIIHSDRALPEEKAQVKDLKDELEITQLKSCEMITAVQEREDNISDRFTRLESRMEEMRTQLNDTQFQLALTESRQTELLKMKSDLHTGQTAYNFEKDLACYIYPPGMFSTYDRRIFSNLMKWLRENRDTHEGEEANKRWNDLVDEFGWTNQHKPVFLKMVKCRKYAAHPPLIDLGLPISDQFNDDEKKMVEDIRRMAVELNKRLSGNR